MTVLSAPTRTNAAAYRVAADCCVHAWLQLGCLTRSSSNFSSFFGGLPWICHSMYLVYRHTMDEALLTSIVPLLKRATNLYLHTAQRGHVRRQ